MLEVPGRTFRFELHDYGGPYVLGKHGHPLADQPGARSLFWEAYWQWDRQGRQVDDRGRCIFKWETAPVHVTKQVGRPLPVRPQRLLRGRNDSCTSRPRRCVTRLQQCRLYPVGFQSPPEARLPKPIL